MAPGVAKATSIIREAGQKTHTEVEKKPEEMVKKSLGALSDSFNHSMCGGGPDAAAEGNALGHITL